MADNSFSIDSKAALDRLMRFLSVEGITGQEKAIAQEVTRALREIGVPTSAIKHDRANEKIPLPTQTGNLIVQLPGTHSGPRLLFSTHMDTVPLAAGAVPTRQGKKIVPKGKTALGGDNRTGVGVLVTLASTLLSQKLPYPPLTLLFTVREESGLFGARYLDPADLGHPTLGFNVDGRNSSEFTIGAVGAERWEVEIHGKPAHAGVAPEQGISATMIAALALAQIQQAGWFGKIRQKTGEGTSNIGSIMGRDGGPAGDATNVVTDYARITGEARSHEPKFVKEIVKQYRDAFTFAAGNLTDHMGKKAKIQFTSRLDYSPFRLKESSPVVQRAFAAAQSIGQTPSTKIGNGGLDANWLVKHGIPTVTFGAGQNGIHTIDEFVDVDMYLRGCQMALAIATFPE